MNTMNRTLLTSAVLLTAALSTAACDSGQKSSSAAASSSADGTQSYASILELDAAVAAGTHCSGLATQPTTLAKSQATCDLPSGSKLVLQVWRDAAGRDAGVQQQATALSARKATSCFVVGRGAKALWSVDASADTSACTTVATTTGGRVVKANGSTKG
jgi:hypothetical protein